MGIEVLAIGSMIATVAGGVVGAMGQKQMAESQAASSRYQAQVAENNAIIAQQNATYARQAGQSQAYTNQLKTRAMIGEQKAKQGASGLDVNTGSPLDVRVSTAELGELDTLTILNNAEKEALGREAQGSNFRAQAQLNRMEADNYESAGSWKMASSLIGAASSVAGKWSGYQQSGAF